MKLSRRQLFTAAFGAAQVALLSRFAGRPRARNLSGPSKLLALYVDGGLHWETFFSPLTSAGIAKFIPAPTGGSVPWGYKASQVENFDRTAADLAAPGPVRKLRGPISWNWAMPTDAAGLNPASGGTQLYRPSGYIFANPSYKLYDKLALLVGADQGTAAHESGRVASLCGVAGASFRAPAVQAVLANAMASSFPDRPLPNVSLGGPLPRSFNLPSAAAPLMLSGAASVQPMMSDRDNPAWQGLRTRTSTADVSFTGAASGNTYPATLVEKNLLDAIRADRQRSSAGTDAMIEQLYDNYKNFSRTIARDILTKIEATPGFEKLAAADSAYPRDYTTCIGYADSCGGPSTMGDFDFAVRLLKSDLVTSVTLRATSIKNFSFDTHTATGVRDHSNHLRIAMEQIGRTIVELSLTPSTSGGGRTMLDDTVVWVFSEFGRTFPKFGSDHHPATCMMLAGNNIVGNQMIGGYDETMNVSPMGIPVNVTEESGERATRTLNAQDFAATVLGAFGLQPGKDFFIPGGYGIIDGVYR